MAMSKKMGFCSGGGDGRWLALPSIPICCE